MSGALAESAQTTLSGWRTPDPSQEQLRQEYLRHLRDHPGAVFRDGPPEHLTTSCAVLDRSLSRILLTHHRKGRFWVQFGGHLEPGDASLRDAAAREAAEESGLSGLELSAEPIELHRHGLPGAFGRCREHLDVVYLAIAPGDALPQVSSESLDVAWWPVADPPDTVVADLPARVNGWIAAAR